MHQHPKVTSSQSSMRQSNMHHASSNSTCSSAGQGQVEQSCRPQLWRIHAKLPESQSKASHFARDVCILCLHLGVQDLYYIMDILATWTEANCFQDGQLPESLRGPLEAPLVL